VLSISVSPHDRQNIHRISSQYNDTERPLLINDRIWRTIRNSIDNMCTCLMPGRITRDESRDAVISHTRRNRGPPIIESPPVWQTKHTEVRVAWLEPFDASGRRVRGLICVCQPPMSTILTVKGDLVLHNDCFDWAEMVNNLIHHGLIEGEFLKLQGREVAAQHRN